MILQFLGLGYLPIASGQSCSYVKKMHMRFHIYFIAYGAWFTGDKLQYILTNINTRILTLMSPLWHRCVKS